MKAVKIILGIIITLTVAFLATGLIFKEIKYTTEVVINKPIKEVFLVFNDHSKISNWIPEIETIEVIDEKPEKTGSTYKVLFKSKEGEKIAAQERILAYIPDEKVTLRFNSATMLKTNDHIFSFADGVTTIKNNSTCIGSSYLLSCLFPFYKGNLKKIDQEYLNNFKSFIEKK